jgi:hypothetical protein
MSSYNEYAGALRKIKQERNALKKETKKYLDAKKKKKKSEGGRFVLPKAKFGKAPPII